MNDEVVVFIASANTTTTPYRRVLWRVSRSDAMKICSDPRTMNTRHMLCFDGSDIDDPTVNRYVRDNGRYADVLAEHAVTVLRQKAA